MLSAAPRERLFHTFLLVSHVVSSPWCSLACRCIGPIAASIVIWHSPHVLCFHMVFFFCVSLLIKTPVILEAILLECDLILIFILIISAKNLSPKKVTFTGTRAYNFDMSLWGTIQLKPLIPRQPLIHCLYSWIYLLWTLHIDLWWPEGS